MATDSGRDIGSGRTDDRAGARQWLIVIGAVLLILLFVLNLQQVEVHLLVATVDMPLIIALVISALLGVLLGWAVPRLRRGGPQRSDAG